jgi:antitoxin HigA-1
MIQELFLNEGNISRKELAKAMAVPLSTVNKLCTGKQKITGELAIRLGVAFGTSYEMWMNLQNHADIWQAYKSMLKKHR